MSPSTRGTRTTRVRKSSRTSTRIALPRARVVLERMNLEQTIELQDSPNPQEATRDNQANVSSSTPRTSARRGRANRLTVTLGPAIRQPTLLPPTDEVPVPIAPTVEAPTTPTRDPAEDVAIVDLVTSAPRPLSGHRSPPRPLEVDLTCDLDDEVFVVLEDIVNPSRRTNGTGSPLRAPAPVALGPSPPRLRVLCPRQFRRHYARPIDTAVVSNQQTEPTIEDINQQPSTSSAGEQPSSDAVSLAETIHCPICLDTLNQIKSANNQMHSTICGHLFCGPCINRAVANTKQCPTCRRSLDLRKVHPIFI